MNVYHKVLTKVFDISGGRDNVDVDLVDLTKKEGFYANIDSISKQLLDEGWITPGSKKNSVRITHWGAIEAKRVLSASPDKANELTKESNRLKNEGKELSLLIEEFASNPDSAKLEVIEKRVSGIGSRCKTIREYL